MAANVLETDNLKDSFCKRVTTATSILQESRTMRHKKECQVKRKELNKEVFRRNKNVSRKKNWSREEVHLGHHG